MDPRDRLQPFANGVDCAVCGGLVPMDRIRILARRDDLAFLARELLRLGGLDALVGRVGDGPDRGSV